MSKFEEVEVPVRPTNQGTYKYPKYMRDGSVRMITAVRREPKGRMNKKKKMGAED